MRVTTAFNRLLRLPGAMMVDVSFGAEVGAVAGRGDALIVAVLAPRVVVLG